MSQDIVQQVHHYLIAHQLFSPDTRIVVGVSGGPDSLCLMHVLAHLRDVGGPTLHIAHLDHRFRGAESADEAVFVAQTATAWHIPATVESRDVAHIAHTQRRNKQTAARHVRYQFLAQVAHQTGAHAVAVAHHADDQAETVLLHLLRGAGLAGLRGMRAVVEWEEWGNMGLGLESTSPNTPPTKPRLLRPLLLVSRTSIESYCDQYALAPRYDSSNASPAYTRNRLRADLLPRMQHYNPHVVAALGRTAQLCADDYAWMQQQLDGLWNSNDNLVVVHNEWVCFDKAAWSPLPIALQRYALRRAAFHLNPHQEQTFDQIEAALAAVQQATGFQQPLGGGLLLRVEYALFRIFTSTGDTIQDALVFNQDNVCVPQLCHAPLTLTIPGSIALDAHWTIYAYTSPPDDDDLLSSTLVSTPSPSPTLSPSPLQANAHEQHSWRWWVVLDSTQLGYAPTGKRELRLRTRQPGDRFRPAGGRGSRLVQNFLVDRKVPRGLRDRLPIVTTLADEIVWVAGLRADARFVAKDEQDKPDTPNASKVSERVWLVIKQPNKIML